MKPSPGRIRRSFDLWRARRDGKRDGLLGIPTAEEPAPPPALIQIAQRAHEVLADLCRGLATDGVHRQGLVGAAEVARQTAEDETELAARTVAAAEQRREQVDARWDSFAMQAPAERGPRLGRRVYGFAIAAILVAEFPLNAIAFRLFGEAEVLTWVMTASLAVTLVLCAHGLGSFLRQTHPSMAERRWVIVLVALPVLAILAIALIRARYLSVEADLTGLDTLGPVVGSLAFLVINLLVYTGATMLSYLAHAPFDREAQRVAQAAATAERELADAQRQLTEASRRDRQRQEQRSKAGASADEALRVARARADEVIAYHRGLMAAYCTANLRARGNPHVPEGLRELPAIEVPAPLHEVAPEAPSSNGHASEASVQALGGAVAEAHR